MWKLEESHKYAEGNFGWLTLLFASLVMIWSANVITVTTVCHSSKHLMLCFVKAVQNSEEHDTSYCSRLKEGKD